MLKAFRALNLVISLQLHSTEKRYLEHFHFKLTMKGKLVKNYLLIVL